LLDATTLTAKFILCIINEVILNKIEIIVDKLTKHFRDILEEDPNFTGNINVSLCLGGLTGIEKKEKMKIK